MTNARQHGAARNVRVGYEQLGSHVLITITDDGAGFDPGQSNQNTRGHFGLGFMRERMEQIGGSVTIESRPGAGTTVKLKAPIRSN